MTPPCGLMVWLYGTAIPDGLRYVTLNHLVRFNSLWTSAPSDIRRLTIPTCFHYLFDRLQSTPSLGSVHPRRVVIPTPRPRLSYLGLACLLRGSLPCISYCPTSCQNASTDSSGPPCYLILASSSRYHSYSTITSLRFALLLMGDRIRR
jgi:hypothetical protein